MCYDTMFNYKIDKSTLVGSYERTNQEVVDAIPYYFYQTKQWKAIKNNGHTLVWRSFRENILVHHIGQVDGDDELKIPSNIIRDLISKCRGKSLVPCIAFTVLNKDGISGQFRIISLKYGDSFRESRRETINGEKFFIVPIKDEEIYNWGKSFIYGDRFEIMDARMSKEEYEKEHVLEFDWSTLRYK